MAASTQQQGYSTLEVDTERQYSDSPNLPEVDRNATADHDYPEAYHNKQEGLETTIPPTTTSNAGAKTICGLRRRWFWIALVVAAIVVIAVAVGVAVGVVKGRNSDNDGGSSSNSGDSNNSTGSGDDKTSSSSTALLKNTQLATANFTDEFNYENYIVIYQMQNRAVYMSTFNSSHNEWVVSPVIDGTANVSLSDVVEGTSLSIAIHRHDERTRNIHLRWQSTKNYIAGLYKGSIATDKVTNISDWTELGGLEAPSAAGSSIAGYGRGCQDCSLVWAYMWQTNNDGLSAVYAGPDLNYAKLDSSAAANTSLALTWVEGINTDTPIIIFYQTSSSTVGMVTYNGLQTSESEPLPRGLSGERSAITAWSTGYRTNDTENEPASFGYQVLTVDTDSSDKVMLTYYKDDEWTAADEVESLSSCAELATMVSHKGQRVYCLQKSEDDDDDGAVEIVEWMWKGDPEGDVATFLEYEKVGSVKTPT